MRRQKPCGFGQQQPQEGQQQQRHDPAKQQHRLPAVAGDQPSGDKTAQPRAHIEAGEHDGDEQRTVALRQVFGQQRGGVGQRGTQRHAGQQTQERQFIGVAGEGASQAQDAEAGDRKQHDSLATQTVRVGARGQCADGQTDHTGTHHRAKCSPRQTPFLNQRRRDKAHHCHIKAVEQHHEKTQCQNQPLVFGHGPVVDPGFYIDRFESHIFHLIIFVVIPMGADTNATSDSSHTLESWA